MAISKISDDQKSLEVPKLRFKEFTDNLSTIKLKDVSKLYKGSNLTKDVIHPDAKTECIHYGELFTKLNIICNDSFSRTDEKMKTFSKGNDLLIATKTSGYANVFKWIPIKKEGVAIGDAINAFDLNRSLNNEYISLVLNSKKNSRKVSRLIEGTIARQLLSKYLTKIKFSISSNIMEQNKIVNFFTLLIKQDIIEKKIIEKKQKAKIYFLNNLF